MDKHSHPNSWPSAPLRLVLAGGRGSRLQALTDRRTKPAVYFGGKFRIIDFALSNCLNSGVRRNRRAHAVQVAIRCCAHLQRGWSFLRNEFNEFIDLLPAQQRMDDESWYLGTADAVYQNLDILRSHNPEYILILAGDHIYKMDYAELIADHVAQGKQCTVACIEVPITRGQRLRRDGHRRSATASSNSSEKPVPPALMPGKPRRGAGLHGHLRVRRPGTCSRRSTATPPRRAPATISART
jgi:glucose-1-phosphate adenylyltransferase